MLAVRCQGQFKVLRTQCKLVLILAVRRGLSPLPGQGTWGLGSRRLSRATLWLLTETEWAWAVWLQTHAQSWTTLYFNTESFFKNPPNYYIKWRDDFLQVQKNGEKSLSTLTPLKERKYVYSISNEIEIIKHKSEKNIKNPKLIFYKTWCCRIGKSAVQDDFSRSLDLPKLTQRQETGPRVEWDSHPSQAEGETASGWIPAGLWGTGPRQVSSACCQSELQRGGQMRQKIEDPPCLTDQQSPIQGVREKTHNSRCSGLPVDSGRGLGALGRENCRRVPSDKEGNLLKWKDIPQF